MHRLSHRRKRGLRLSEERQSVPWLTRLWTARSFRAAMLGSAVLLLILGAAAFGDEEEEPAASATISPTVWSLEPLSHEIEDEVEVAHPELDEHTEDTLARLRDFWERESLPKVDDLYFQPFQLPPRKPELEYYPCLDCHEDHEINNPRERKLKDEHEDIILQHGANRFWCTTCHNLTNMNTLRSLKDRKIDFDRSYLVCGQCHFQRQQDWFAGGHGKRIGNWAGTRVILVCVECHNPHSPSIKPHRPDPPPERHHKPYNIVVEVLDAVFK